MTRRRRKAERPIMVDGWFWVRLFIPLRRGHYNYEWSVVRMVGGKVQLFGSGEPIPFDAPVLNNALWRGPLSPPSLDESGVVQSLEKVERSHIRKMWHSEGAAIQCESEPGPMARAVADGIVEAFIQTVEPLKRYYREHVNERIELVEKIAGLVQRAIR